jgi:NAD(P)-dependent dehydrogenase (short-subunit alcohol dehydrogenase family)
VSDNRASAIDESLIVSDESVIFRRESAVQASSPRTVAVDRTLAGGLAVVTGGASGIGRGTALALAAQGMRVVLADIDGEAVTRAAQEIQHRFGVAAHGVVADVVNADAMRALAADVAAREGDVHLLFNNAGVMAIGPVLQHSSRDWQWQFDVNVIGVANGLNAFVPGMVAHGQPCRVLNTASMAAFAPSADFPAYAASKQAVLGLTEALRDELAGTNVSVSVVCPGAVNTQIGHSERHRQPAYGPATGREVPSGPEQVKASLQLIEPEEAGRRIIDGVLHGEFWIFTHPEWTRRIRSRFDDAYDAAQRTLARRG